MIAISAVVLGSKRMEQLRAQALRMDFAGAPVLVVTNERELCDGGATAGLVLSIIGAAAAVVALIMYFVDRAMAKRACAAKAKQLYEQCIMAIFNTGEMNTYCGAARLECCDLTQILDTELCRSETPPPAPTGGIAAGCLTIACP
jgi:hypothetical protein